MIKRVFLALFLSAIVFIIASGANASDNVSNVLGRKVRLDALCANFENENWLDDYNRGDDYWHETRSDYKRGLESLKRVTSPAIGSGALEISRISDPRQQEMLSPAFSGKLGHKLSRSDRPVFIVRLWLPPLDQWGESYHFGFRQEVRASNIPSEYSTSIWVKKDQDKISFYFRAANGQDGDVPGGPKVEPGWWTLAIAFDDKGIGHYYVSQGIGILTEKNKRWLGWHGKILIT